MIRFHILCIALALLVGSCRTSQISSVLQLSQSHQLRFLSQTEAAQAIVTDQTNHYFDLVQPIEISIQLKKPVASLPTDRKQLMAEYTNFLKGDVLPFNDSDRKKMEPILSEIFKTCESVVPGLFPKEIKLIKTAANHYGPGVYYTRENCIIIPTDALDHFASTEFRKTMYHETWHIISRLNPQLQKQVYALIGFQPLDMKQITIPASLLSHLIYNPDGVDMGWQINLTDNNGKPKTAIPLLHTTQSGYKSSKSAFFDYLEFNLYHIDQGKIMTKSDGVLSTLSIDTEPSFFSQITDNTTYIIHPDEVIADNFMFLMTTATDVKERKKYSTSGQALLNRLETTLKQYKL
jgi:hypothetical protein